ncbi:MAG: FtsX-like permease family protein [Verrucomicrobiota bacterium]|nr:FtsX-like permease family protein [Verrucomicrobiota bacterium]
MRAIQDFKLAFRNVFRNTRRSLATIIAIMLSCAGLILFGGYVTWAFRSAESQGVVIFSHLQLARPGFYDKGAGNPTAYAIDTYPRIKQLLEQDAIIGPKLQMITAQTIFKGIVSYSAARTSSTFVGLGVFPEEDWALLHWNPYHITSPLDLPANKAAYGTGPELSSEDPEGVTIGIGLSKVLQISFDPKERERQATSTKPVTRSDSSSSDLAVLSEELTRQTNSAPSQRPAIELLCAPPGGGMPNAMTMSVRKIFNRPTKELDNQTVKLDIRRASELFFPGEELKVTSILVLLKQTADLPAVVARLHQLIADGQLDLEFRTWTELRPFFSQLTQMFRVMFTFMFCIIAAIVIFTIYNTLSTSIAERMAEIGTLRAMGVTRAGIRKTFLLEGIFLGLIGGILGVLLAILGETIVNSLGVVYIPPGGSFYTKMEVIVLRAPLVLVVCFGGSLVAALFSAIFPAHRASRMIIVDALRH